MPITLKVQLLMAGGNRQRDVVYCDLELLITLTYGSWYMISAVVTQTSTSVQTKFLEPEMPKFLKRL